MACILTTDKHREWANRERAEGKEVSAEFLAKLDQEFVTITGGLEAKDFSELMSIDKIRSEYLTAILWKDIFEKPNNINNHDTEETNNNGGASLQGGQNQSETTGLAQGVQENSQQESRGLSRDNRNGNAGRLARAKRLREIWMASRNPRGDSRLLSAINRIENGIRNTWDKKQKQLEKEIKIPKQKILPANPEDFYNALIEGRNGNKNGWMVAVHDKDYYNNCICLLSEDGKAGIALNEDGDQVSMFNNSTERGMINLLVPLVIALGSRKGDCYVANSNNNLARLYSRFGYTIVNKIPFNEKIAIKENGKLYTDWKEKNPDSIPRFLVTRYMIADSATSVIENYDPSPNIDFLEEGVLPEMDYEEAMDDRDEKLKAAEENDVKQNPINQLNQSGSTIKEQNKLQQPNQQSIGPFVIKKIEKYLYPTIEINPEASGFSKDVKSVRLESPSDTTAMILVYNNQEINPIFYDFKDNAWYNVLNMTIPDNSVIEFGVPKKIVDALNNGSLYITPEMIRKGYFDFQTPQNVNQTQQFNQQNPVGENIASAKYGGSELGQKLTNQGNTVGITYDGREYNNVEHAYQSLKSGKFDERYYEANKGKAFVSKNSVKPKTDNYKYNLMVNLLVAKLEQHPELIKEINEKGGIEFINKSTHIVNGKKGDYWESTGGNNFINALSEAYKKVTTSNVNQGSNNQQEFEQHFSTTKSASYSERTKANADWSDITLALAVNFNTAGEKLTKNVAGDKYIGIEIDDNLNSNNSSTIAKGVVAMSAAEAADEIVDEIKKRGLNNIKLNVAGNGIRAFSEATNQEGLDDFVTQVLELVQENGITISEIRSGGQTGIDEAGIKAAQKLGIPWSVLTTSDWKFRGRDNKDISGDKAAFMARFMPNGQQLNQNNNTINNNSQTLSNQGNNYQSFDEGLVEDPFEKSRREDALKQAQQQVIQTSTQKDEKQRSRFTNTNRIDSTNRTRLERLKDMGLESDNIHDMAETIASWVTREINGVIYDLEQDYGTDLDNVIKQRDDAIERGESKEVINDLNKEINEYRSILTTLQDEDASRIEAINKIGGIGELLKIVKKEVNQIASLDDEHFAIRFRIKDEDRFDRLRKIWDIFNTNEAFDLLSEEAIKYINELNNIDVYHDEDELDEESNRTSSSEGWSFHARNVDPIQTARGIVKRFLSSKIENLDKDGRTIANSIGTESKITEEALHTIINDECAKGIYYADDFSILNKNGKITFPLFEKISDKYPWVKQIIRELSISRFDDHEKIKEKMTLVTAFYNDFRRDKINWGMINPVSGNLMILNSTTSARSAYNQARNNYDKGLNSENTIWNKDKSFDKEYAKKVRKSLIKLIDDYNKILPHYITSWGERIYTANKNDINNFLDKIEKNNIIDRTIKAFECFGFSVDNETLMSLLIEDYENENFDNFHIIKALQSALDVIADANEKWNEGKELFQVPKINTAFKRIADVIGKISSSYITSTVREHGKQLQNYCPPSYIDTLVKRLTDPNENRRQNFIRNEFGKDSFLCNQETDEYRVTWLDLLTHPTLDNPNEIEDANELPYYRDMQICEVNMVPDCNTITLKNKKDVLVKDYTQCNYNDMLVNEIAMFNSFGVNGTEAWYQGPIYSESPACNFIKFKKYSIYDAGQNGIMYDKIENIMIPLFRNIIYQELTRIKKVQDRKKAGIHPIVNYDKRGDKFCFFPELNDYVFQNDVDITETTRTESNIGEITETTEVIRTLPTEGKAFMEAYKEAKDNGDKEAADNIIDAALKDIIRNSFDNFMRDIKARGLYDMVDKKTGIDESPIAYVLDRQGDYRDRNDEKNNMAQRCLNHDHRLYEFYLNSMFATAQIIQLTTTDIAYYKDLTDFQKRFKEAHASGMKFNTNSLYGKKHQTVVYINDTVKVSTSYNGVKASLDKAVREGRLSKQNRDRYLKKFTEIESTDGQSYYSPESLRSFFDMLGRWTPELERTFDNLRNNKYDERDLFVAINTMKAFMYDTPNNPDGLNGYNRTPTQIKDSEMPILNMFSALGQLMSDSVELRAISKFMEDNHIDKITRPSASKVGTQGCIDINSSDKKVGKALRTGKIRVDVKDKDGNRTSKTYQVVGNNYEEMTYGRDKSGNPIKGNFLDRLEKGDITQEEYNAIIDYFRPTENEIYDKLTLYTRNQINRSNIRKQGNLEEGENEYEFSDVMISDDDGNQYNSTYVSILDNENYMIAQPTPNHLADVQSILGSQMRNLEFTNLPETLSALKDEYGRPMRKEDVITEFQMLMTENILQEYGNIEGVFGDIENLQKKIKACIRSNPNFGRDMLNAFEIVERGGKKVFNLPLSSPQMFYKTMQLLNSFFKNSVTREFTKGGSAYIASDYGMLGLNVNRDEDGKILSVDCYLPAYAKELYGQYITKITDNNGEVIGHKIDIESVPRELLEVIGYRSPTATKAQMLPLNIKGFLPATVGSVIILPSDVVVHAGSDFDIDKLLMMFPEFEERNVYNLKQAWDDFYKDNPDEVDRISAKQQEELDKEIKDGAVSIKGKKGYEKALKRKQRSKKQNEWLDSTKEKFTEWFTRERKEKYKIGTRLEKVQYYHYEDENGNIDYAGSPELNSRKARNNRMIELFRGILTSEGVDLEFNSPTNFDDIINMANFQKAVNDPKIIDAYIKDINKNRTNAAQKEGVEPQLIDSLSVKQLKYLINHPDYLSDLVKSSATEMNPLLPTVFPMFHERNMVGQVLIAKYAVQSASHAKMQGHGFKIKDAYQFTVNGRIIDELDKEWVSLDPSKPELRIRITSTISQMQEASVDNGKNPVLYLMGQNTQTANIGGFLARAGLTINEISLFLNQPEIKSIIEDLVLHGRDILAIDSSYNDEMKNMGEGAFVNMPKTISINTDYMLGRTLIEMHKNKLSDIDRNKLSSQTRPMDIMYAKLFIQIYKMAQKLADVNRVTRADSPTAAVKPDLAGALNQIFALSDVLDESKLKKYPFEGVFDTISCGYLLDEDGEPVDIDTMRERLKESNMPMLQAFFSLGIEHATILPKNYFVQLLPQVFNIVNKIRRNTNTRSLSDKDIKTIYDAVVYYALAQTDFFGDSRKQIKNGSLRTYSSYEWKRDYYVNKFPTKFLQIVQNNKRIRNLSVISRLGVENNKIILKDGADVRGSLYDRFMSDIEKLVNFKDKDGNPDKEARNLALELLLHSYYTDCFKFGPDSYAHLFSSVFLSQVPDYINGLEVDTVSKMSEKEWNNLCDQIYANNPTLAYTVKSDKINIDISKDGKKVRFDKPLTKKFNPNEMPEWIYIHGKDMLLRLQGTPVITDGGDKRVGEPIYLIVEKNNTDIMAYNPKKNCNVLMKGINEQYKKSMDEAKEIAEQNLQSQENKTPQELNDQRTQGDAFSIPSPQAPDTSNFDDNAIPIITEAEPQTLEGLDNIMIPGEKVNEDLFDLFGDISISDATEVIPTQYDENGNPIISLDNAQNIIDKTLDKENENPC